MLNTLSWIEAHTTHTNHDEHLRLINNSMSNDRALFYTIDYIVIYD